jgi:hypothetical protein
MEIIMADDVTPPIVVPSSAIPETTLALVRYVLTTLGGALLVKRGIISNGELQDIVGALLVVLPTAYGMWLTRRNNAKQQTMAEHLPDEIAQVQS